ncbi:hypothetical protein ACLOJK_039330 [Asimina triloba]
MGRSRVLGLLAALSIHPRVHGTCLTSRISVRGNLFSEEGSGSGAHTEEEAASFARRTPGAPPRILPSKPAAGSKGLVPPDGETPWHSLSSHVHENRMSTARIRRTHCYKPGIPPPTIRFIDLHLHVKSTKFPVTSKRCKRVDTDWSRDTNPHGNGRSLALTVGAKDRFNGSGGFHENVHVRKRPDAATQALLSPALTCRPNLTAFRRSPKPAAFPTRVPTRPRHVTHRKQ